jgi:pantoate--beta-alanine ligase
MSALMDAVRRPIADAADRVDYISCADPDTLAPVSGETAAPERLFIAAAAFFGPTRLIDNTVLGEDALPAY